MQVTVTGGAGFIGSAVVRAALAANLDVVVLDNLSTGFESNLHGLSGVKFVRGDIRDTESVNQALRGSEGVFHLAAHVGNVRSIEDPVSDQEVNVFGTLNLLEAMRRHGITRMVYSSSAAIYGESKTTPIAEDHPCEPTSPYGVSKLCAEKYSLCFGYLYGWSVACLRYFNVYGERQRFDAYGNVIPIFATRLMQGNDLIIYGDGKQTRDFVNVDDVAQANVKSFLIGARGAFNVATGYARDVNYLARQLLVISGVNCNVRHTAQRDGEVRHSLANIELSSSQLAYVPKVGLDLGLAQYWRWLKRQKELSGSEPEAISIQE